MGCFELLDLGPQAVAVGEALVELGDLVTEDPNFLFQDLTSLFGGLRDLLGGSEFVHLRGREGIEFSDALVAFRKSPFELLDGAAMGGLSIAQFNFQLVDAVLGCFELLDLSAEPISISQALIELRNVLAQDSHFAFHDLPGLLGVPTGLLSASEFMCLGCKNCLDITHTSASCDSFRFRVCQLLRPCGQFCFKHFQPFAASGQLSLSRGVQRLSRHDFLFEDLHGRCFDLQVV